MSNFLLCHSPLKFQELFVYCHAQLLTFKWGAKGARVPRHRNFIYSIVTVAQCPNCCKKVFKH